MTDRRQWLYHADCPQGRIFEGDAIAQAVKEGWLDSPAKIGALGPLVSDGRPATGDEPDCPAAPTAKPKRGAKAS